MDAKEAKELLQPIPNEDFIRNKYSDEIGKCCAVGHLIRLKSEDPSDFSIENCTDWSGTFLFNPEPEVGKFVREECQNFLFKKHKILSCDLASVNNYNNINGYGYDDENIKNRVMKLLDDMIEAGY